MKIILKSLEFLGIFSGGVVAYYFGSKLLDRVENIEEKKFNSIRDDKFDEIVRGIKYLKENSDKIQAKAGELEKNKLFSGGKIPSKLEDNFKVVEIKGNKILEELKKSSLGAEDKDSLSKDISDMSCATEKFKKFLEELSNVQGNNDTKFRSTLSDVYHYLDSLSLLEESAVFHILIFLVLSVVILNILGVLFGNKIINYFNLEKRYPSFAIFFNLRQKFQNYYLI